MGRKLLLSWSGALTLLLAGCMTGPLLDNPVLLQPGDPGYTGNPVYVPLPPRTYRLVFEKVIDVLDDYYEIAAYNYFEGRIETLPRIAPGLEQPWKAGSPDFDQRLLATFQTIRHRAVVTIEAAAGGSGFFIDVKVYKELEDLERPTRATAGAASFRSDPTLERQFEVIDASTPPTHDWIPVGRDLKLEQVILQRLAKLDLKGAIVVEGK
jgi:hypothetical protein